MSPWKRTRIDRPGATSVGSGSLGTPPRGRSASIAWKMYQTVTATYTTSSAPIARPHAPLRGMTDSPPRTTTTSATALSTLMITSAKRALRSASSMRSCVISTAFCIAR